MSLISIVVPVISGYQVDMQSFYDAHPLLTFDDIQVHKVDEQNGISLTYDDTKEQV